MGRSHFAPLWIAGLAGLAGALGCGGGGGGNTSGTAGNGGNGTTTTTGTGGHGGATSTTSSSTTSTSTSSSSGTGGAATTSSTTSSSSSGTGGNVGTGGAATGGSGGAGGGCQVLGAACTTSGDCCSGGACSNGVCTDAATLDQDGDGWTPADGDCCDVATGNCQEPDRVNPGAFEYPGNGVDDDCDPSTPDLAPPPDCSTAAKFSGVTGDDLVKAMELCQFTQESPALAQKKWGVIQTKLLLADGSSPLPAADNVQVGVLTNYGTYVSPQKYGTMAAISSGTARTPADPGYVHPQNGGTGQTGNFNGNTQVKIQSGYLAANGGKPPAPAACSAACTSGCDQAYDSVNLWARIRVPTNAKSFSYQFKFYSAEFPEYLCQKFNDFFVALLKSSWTPDPLAMPPQSPLPADGNIAFDANKKPVSVNNSFFQVCFPPVGAAPGTCPSGTLDLVGNGMGGWGTNLKDGGGTDWLTNTAPVVPGETIELQFIIWDAGDHNVDSLVLLDHFRWSITASPVGVSK